MSPTPPDLSEFQALSNSHPTACVIARSRAQLGKRDRENLDHALTLKDDEGEYVVSNNAIARWLKGKSLAGRDGAVHKHRDGGCCCA